MLNLWFTDVQKEYVTHCCEMFVVCLCVRAFEVMRYVVDAKVIEDLVGTPRQAGHLYQDNLAQDSRPRH